MTLDRTNEIIALALAIAALAGLVLGWLRWARPRYRATRKKITAVSDAIIGRDPVVDTITGRELAPALPGIGQRMATVEKAVEKVAHLLETQTVQDRRIESLETRVTEAHKRIDALESGAIERVASKAESISAWRAVEAVAKQADPTTPEIEDN